MVGRDDTVLELSMVHRASSAHAGAASMGERRNTMHMESCSRVGHGETEQVRIIRTTRNAHGGHTPEFGPDIAGCADERDSFWQKCGR